MLVVVVLVLVVLVVGAVADRRGWPWARPVLEHAERARVWVTAVVVLAPATSIYLFVLAVTTWVVRSSDPRVSDLLLASHSTNLHNLEQDPVRSLVGSAFWLEPPSIVLWAALFALAMAPAERWLGTARMLGAFAVGHVAATLLTAVVLDHDLLGLTGSDEGGRAVDVGVSYGWFCVAALLTYRMAGRWRTIWAAGVAVAVVVPFVATRTFTTFGHLTAATIGIALWPLTLAPDVRARRTRPIWAPPPDAVAAARATIEARRAARRRG